MPVTEDGTEKLLFTTAAVYYLKRVNVPHVNDHFALPKKLHQLG